VARDEGGAESITLPERSQFKNSEDYYSVLLHEASHATGATFPKRLGRPMLGRHDTESYSREELTSETASYFLLSELGLGQSQNTGEADSHELVALTSTTARTAAYLSSWRELILADPKALFHAFAQAEKAADWVMQRHAHQLEMMAGMDHDGQALVRDVGQRVEQNITTVIEPDMTIQTWQQVHNGHGHVDENMTANPWGVSAPVAAGMAQQDVQRGFGGFGVA